jgi:molecular chaperone DnaK
VVSFPESGERIVGRAARMRRAFDPRNTVYSVKRLLGRPFKSEEVRRARSRVAFDLKEGADSSVLVLDARRDHVLAARALGHGAPRGAARRRGGAADKVEKCVVTVPANFNELQRSSTKVAGRIAELEVVRILNEPTAAALAYGYGRGTREKICIYDFGGGTFDVTLLELSGNVFEVLATAGDTFLGGDDIDIAITDSLVPAPSSAPPRSTRCKTGCSTTSCATPPRPRSASSRRRDSSRLNWTSQPGPAGPVRFEHSRSRAADLERLAAPFISRTFDVCSEALKLAGLRPTDLTAVILVGGSTRIPGAPAGGVSSSGATRSPTCRPRRSSRARGARRPTPDPRERRSPTTRAPTRPRRSRPGRSSRRPFPTAPCEGRRVLRPCRAAPRRRSPRSRPAEGWSSMTPSPT